MTVCRTGTKKRYLTRCCPVCGHRGVDVECVDGFSMLYRGLCPLKKCKSKGPVTRGSDEALKAWQASKGGHKYRKLWQKPAL